MGAFERIVEEKILQAMARGDFDNLPGSGKPLDLSDYFRTPPRLRIGFQILKNYGISPTGVDLNKQIDILRKELRQSAVTEDRKDLIRSINYKMMLLNIELEKINRK